MKTSYERWDQPSAWIAALAACASVVSFLVYFRNGEILLYGDAVAHINIARRVFDSRTPGPLQLGTVWLPLAHLLMIPFVVAKRTWETGMGGSLPSMMAYGFGVVGIFRLVRSTLRGAGRPETWANWTAAFAAAIYGLNPNLLYLQSTAMTESLYLALFVWSIVYFSEFVRAATSREGTAGTKRSLWKCGLCLAAACLTRYDGWFLAASIALLVLYRGLRAGDRPALRKAAVFVLLVSAVPVGWFVYNGVTYKNPLEFANGPYSAKAIEKRTATPGLPPHPGTANPPMAGLYFFKASEFAVAEGNWQRVWAGLGLFGAAVVIFRERKLAPLLFLWLPLPFYMLSVAYGGVPIFTPTWWPFSFYNVRYGIQLLPALAVFVPLAVASIASWIRTGTVRGAVVAAGVGLVVASYIGVWRAQPVCFREAWINSRTRLQLEQSVADQLRRLPANATLLMYLGEHVGALQDAGIPLKHTINEGNHRVWKQPSDPEGLWEQALADPARFADFVIAFEGDVVSQAVQGRGLPAVAIVAVNGQRKATIYQTHGFTAPGELR